MHTTPRIATSLLLACTLASPACAANGELSATLELGGEREAIEAAVRRGELDHDHAAWTELLAAHVRGDALDYRGVAEERAKLERYLVALHAVTPEQLATWREEQRFAYWINVYNANVVRIVVEHYPVDSIRDIGGTVFQRVWDREFIPLAAHHPEGEDDLLSLNDVEHGILRPRFEDARVHAAINCASTSCPPLRAEAFVAERLDTQLDEQMRAFVADPERNRFDRSGGEARVSQIFDWFEEDFERDAGGVREYLVRYAPPADAAFLREARIRYLDYDWSLNDVPRQQD